MNRAIWIDTPVGKIVIEEDGLGISGLDLHPQFIQNAKEEETPLLKKARTQLKEYFAGNRKVFDFPLSLKGTPFQVSVWNALCTIPYGEVRSYKQIAIQVGCPKGCRPVGGANHANPVSIIVPCHRVVGSNGSLTGYGGGLDRKKYLLDLEEQHRE